MKKLFIFLAFLGMGSVAHAVTPEEWNYIPYSSYTEAATPSIVLFTSATIQFVGITVSSPAIGSYLTIWRSTSSSYTTDIATQVMINTDYANLNGGPQFVELFEMKNTSFTYLNKVGNAKVIFWVRCPKPALRRNEAISGVCPGLPWNGSQNFKIDIQEP